MRRGPDESQLHIPKFHARIPGGIMLRHCIAALAAFVVAIPQAWAGIEVGPEFTLPNSALAKIRPPPYYDNPLTPDIAVGRVEVALCGENFLVTWGALDGAVYAARITPAGDVLDAPPLLIAEHGNAPAVASNGDTCIVVWADYTEATAILAARLTPDGQIVDAQPIVVAVGGPAWIGQRQLTFPFVASDGVDYLVTYWGREGGAFSAERMAVVTHDGEPRAPFLGMVSDSTSGPSWAEWAIAYDGTAYLVAFSDLGTVTNWVDTSCVTMSATGSRVCRFDVGNVNYTNPIAAASDGAGFLVLFSSSAGRWPEDDSIQPAALRAAWVSGAPATFESVVLDGKLDPLDPAPSWFAPDYPVVAAFDGRQYVGIWFAPTDPPSQAYGVLLPTSYDGGAFVKQPLFAGTAAVPAFATSGNGTSLLLYASPSAADPAVFDVRGRLVVTDGAPPVVKVPSSIAATATTRGGAVVTFAASAEDDYSGAVEPTCLPASGSVFAPGVTRVDCMAVDGAGNVGTAGFDVSVAFSWSDLLAPVDPRGGSTFKLGRTVPVKFTLTGPSAAIANLDARLLVSKASDAIGGAEETPLPLDAVADAGSAFRWDATAGQYIFNLRTASLSAGTWSLRIVLGDGVDHAVRVSLRP
jgi:HYR domain-containing protein